MICFSLYSHFSGGKAKQPEYCMQVADSVHLAVVTVFRITKLCR